MANWRATSYGSLKVELIVPARPRWSVTAASAASTVNVSGRPTTSRSWIRPLCSRSRSPSARKKKSNLPRSAVWARWTNEAKSMWLPAAGSLHTVVLFTPGKCAARMDLLGTAWSSGLLRRSRGGVAVGRSGQAEQAAQRAPPCVAGAEQPAPLQLGHQRAGDLRQVVRQRGRAQPEPGQPGRAASRASRSASSAGRAGEDRARRWCTRRRPARRGAACGARAAVGAVVEEHHQVGEDVQRSRRPGRPSSLGSPDLRRRSRRRAPRSAG